MKRFLLTTLISLSLAGLAFGETLTIQPSTADTSLQEGSPNTNHGTEDSLLVFSYATLSYRPILKFDFSALPDNATITGTDLDLYYYAKVDGDPVGRTYYAAYMNQTGWVETGATWNNYKTGSAWAVAGGDPGNVGSSVVVPASYGWMSWDVLSMVQYFQSHGKIGYFIIFDSVETGTADKGAVFWSNNYTTDTSLCPKLVITYTVPPPPYSYIF